MAVNQVLNSIGLGFDIYGSWLVLYEVVKRFKGNELLRTPTICGSSPAPEKTPEFKSWEDKRYRKMKLGLYILTLGFICQIISNWI